MAFGCVHCLCQCRSIWKYGIALRYWVLWLLGWVPVGHMCVTCVSIRENSWRRNACSWKIFEFHICTWQSKLHLLDLVFWMCYFIRVGWSVLTCCWHDRYMHSFRFLPSFRLGDGRLVFVFGDDKKDTGREHNFNALSTGLFILYRCINSSCNAQALYNSIVSTWCGIL